MRPRSFSSSLGAVARLVITALLAGALALGAAAPASAESLSPTTPAVEETAPPSPEAQEAEPLAAEVEESPATEEIASGSLRGVVSAEDGSPAAEVSVNLHRFNGEYFEYAAGMQSGGDGAYAFESLEPGTYTLEFASSYGSAFVGEWWNDQREQWSADSFEIAEGDELSGMDATLATGGIVEGVVTGTDGAPLSDVGVTAFAVVDGSVEHRASAWTGPDGTFRFSGLLAGAYTLEFSAPWGSAFAGEWWNDQLDQFSADTFEVVGGQTLSGLVTELSAGGSISGIVTGTDDLPLAGVSVSANGPGWVSATTDADGRYELVGLAAGSYTVSFEADAFDPEAVSGYLREYWDDAAEMFDATPVDVDSGESVTGIDAKLGRAGSISGVVAVDGQPIAGVDVSVSGAGWGSATTDADGRYEVVGLRAGAYDVWFSMPSGVPYFGGGASTEVSDGATAVLDYAPVRAASVSGRITVDGSGAGVAGAAVTLHAFGGATAGAAITDDDGRYVIAPLDGGRYLVEVTGPGITATWSGGSPTRAGADIVSVAASNEAVLDLAAPAAGSGGIAGRVAVETIDGPVAAQGAIVELHDEGGLLRTISTDPDGGYRFEGLDVGRYAVRFAESSWSSTSWWWDGSTRMTARYFDVGAEAVTRDYTLPGLGWITSAVETDGPYSGYIRMEAFDPATGEMLAAGSSWDGDTISLYDVPAGEVKLRFTGPIHDTWWGGGSFADSQTITVPIGGEARADATLSLDTVLTGTVYAPEGAPIPGAYVTISGDGGRSFSAVADDTGVYRVTGLEPDTYAVEVQHAGTGTPDPVIVEVIDGVGEVNQDIRLAQAARLRTSVSYLGQPVETCIGVREISGPYRDTMCDEPGSANAHWLHPGTYRVSVRTKTDMGAAAHIEQVTVEPGQTGELELDVELETGGVVEGRVTADLGDGRESIGAHWVTAHDGFGPAGSAETTADGSYRIWGLQNGVPYTVRFGDVWRDLGMEWWNDASTPGAATAVTPGREAVTGIDAELERGAGLSGRVTDADGLGASFATVEAYSADGDLIGENRADVQGGYRFEGLPTGDVKLRFVPSPEWVPGYLAEWWQDAGSAASASGIAVAAGTETAGIDAELNRVGTVSVELPTPELSGAARVGETLTALAQATTDGVSLGYEWLADDAAIAGAAGAKLVLGPEHLGKRISVRVTATADGYLPTTSSSVPSEPVGPAGVDPTLPRIWGAPVVRERLTVDAGPKPPGSRFAYRWFADGAPIAGPPTSTLRLTDAHVGARITVLVTTLRGRVVVEQRMSEPTLPVQAAAAVRPRDPGAQG
ncbi:carboxypeptidase regulatory-like domain-containing protein [Agromyces sp. NPDC057679]|uniref:carboxypeptidase regulatory-like domain-containing protein n=1 Tax=Agromyces sp. NPDC057679 TaxID=3346207 RepID=UPI003672E684